MMSKPGKTGIPRLIAAASYSMKGLKAAWQHEEAFRLEASLAALFAPFCFVIGDTLTQQLLLLLSCVLVIITELINSAIEAVVDRISPETHPLSGQAKDIGSAAVFIALMFFLASWGLSFWQYFLPA